MQCYKLFCCIFCTRLWTVFFGGSYFFVTHTHHTHTQTHTRTLTHIHSHYIVQTIILRCYKKIGSNWEEKGKNLGFIFFIKRILLLWRISLFPYCLISLNPLCLILFVMTTKSTLHCCYYYSIYTHSEANLGHILKRNLLCRQTWS